MMEVTSASTSPGIIGSHQTAKRKFFQWAVKWFYANMAEDILEKPDAPILVCLLQSIGFQLREFEKIDESKRTERSTKPKNDTVRVFVECGTSGMRACMELSDVKCKCPNSEDAEDASFWSVSGTGPTATAKFESSNKIEESGSNLIPPVSKETGKILHDVTYHLLNMIVHKSSSDINQNSKNRSNMNLNDRMLSSSKDSIDYIQSEKFTNVSTSIVRSYTHPEILLPNATTRKGNWTVREFDSFSMDKDHDDATKWSTDLEAETIDNDQPRSSPPKIVGSSPVFMNQLCSSLGQISLQSEEDNGNVAEHVIQARKSLDKALELLMAKKSPNSRNSSINEQATFLKPAPGGLNLTGGSTRRLSSSSNNSLRSPLISSNSRTSSSCSLSTREQSGVGRISRTSLQLTPKSSTPTTRRSVGSSLSMSTIPSTTNAGSTKRQSSSIENNPMTTKIPGRRKSFSVIGSQPLKIAAASARTTTIGLKKKSPDPKINTVTAGANQSSSQKYLQTTNQPAGNLKFGYVKKKSSLV